MTTPALWLTYDTPFGALTLTLRASMLLLDLAAPATLFEAHDPLDDQLSGQAVLQGALREVVLAAMEFADCRLASARIVTVDERELRGEEIETLFWERVSG